MKKKFKVEVDCANCAAKIENAISKIEGVNAVSVNFLTQKMTLEADDDRFDEILQQAVKTAKKTEAACEIYID